MKPLRRDAVEKMERCSLNLQLALARLHRALEAHIPLGGVVWVQVTSKGPWERAFVEGYSLCNSSGELRLRVDRTNALVFRAWDHPTIRLCEAQPVD